VNDLCETTQASFFELLKTNEFDKITVAMICEAAKISRRTFYRCFNGIDEIVEKMIHDDFLGPPIKLRSVLAMDTIKSGTLLCTESVLTLVFEKRDMYEKLLDFRGHYSLAKIITNQTFAFNMKVFGVYVDDPVELEFSSHMIAVTQAMLVDWWIREKKDISPKLFAKLSNAWVFSHFRELKGISL
jgi:AcrR family transcriptional regulator